MGSGTPSAQVRIPVGDLVFPPPYLCSHYTTWGKINLRRKKISGGGIIIRAGAGGPKIQKKKPKTVAQCRKYPIPYLYTFNQTIPYPYTLSRTIPYRNTLSRTIPYLNTLPNCTYLNTLSRTIPYLNTLSRTIPYLDTLSRTIPYLNTLRKNPNLTQNQILVGSQSESSTKKS